MQRHEAALGVRSGQTGTGKTYTMMGGDYLGSLNVEEGAEEGAAQLPPHGSEMRGIVPRAVEELFSRLREARP